MYVILVAALLLVIAPLDFESQSVTMADLLEPYAVEKEEGIIAWVESANVVFNGSQEVAKEKKLVDRKDCKSCGGDGKVSSGDGLLEFDCPNCKENLDDVLDGSQPLVTYCTCAECMKKPLEERTKKYNQHPVRATQPVIRKKKVPSVTTSVPIVAKKKWKIGLLTAYWCTPCRIYKRDVLGPSKIDYTAINYEQVRHHGEYYMNPANARESNMWYHFWNQSPRPKLEFPTVIVFTEDYKEIKVIGKPSIQELQKYETE